MAQFIRRSTSRRGSVGILFDDVTLRTIQVTWAVNFGFLRIVIFDNSGEIVADLDTRIDVSPTLVDAPCHLSRIQTSDGSIKAFVSPLFAIYF